MYDISKHSANTDVNITYSCRFNSKIQKQQHRTLSKQSAKIPQYKKHVFIENFNQKVNIQFVQPQIKDNNTFFFYYSLCWEHPLLSSLH
jgi:hypothetical protein